MSRQNVAVELDYVNPITTQMMGEGVFDPRWQVSRATAAWVMNRNCQIEKVPANVPRAAYNSAGQGNGGTGTWRGWLFEPTRTNNLTYANPNGVVPTGWTNFTSGGAATVTLESAFGLNSIRWNVTSAGRRAIYDITNIASKGSVIVCFSAYVNLDTFTGDPAAQLINLTGFTGATIDASLANVNNADADGRIRLYATLASDINGVVWVGPGAAASAATGVYELTGWQIEEIPNTSSLPTSLIVTTGSTATRQDDGAIIDGDDFTGLGSVTAGGAISVDAEFLNPTVNEWWSAISDGTVNEIIRYASNTSNVPRREVIDGGVSQSDITAVSTYPDNRVNFLLSPFNVINVNGNTEVFAFGGTQPTVDRWEVGNNVTGEQAVVIKNLWFGERTTTIDNNGFEQNGEFKGTAKFALHPVADDDHDTRLMEAPLYEIEPELWIWGNRQRSSVGDIELVNIDNELDYLLGWPSDNAANKYSMRGQKARILTGDAGDLYANYTQVAEVTIDFAGVSNSGNVRVAFASLDIDLCRPIQNFIYDAAPNSNIDGDPYPITLGRCRQVPAIDYDPANGSGPVYHVHDEVFSETSFTISQVQSNGNPALGSQWAVVNYGFQFNITPSGKVTAYISQGVFGTDCEEIIEGVVGAGSAYARAKFIDYNATELNTVCADFSNPIAGKWIDESETVKCVLRWLLDPFLGWFYVDANGQLRFGRLEDPATSGASVVATITPENVIEGTVVKPEDDLMSGLTDRMGGQRNWHPIPKESVATSLSLADQATVAAEHRISSKIGRGQLAAEYRWAENGQTFSTGLDDQTDLDACVSNLLDIASIRRRFYRVSVSFEELPEIKPGDLVNLTWPGFGLENGEDLTAVGISYRFGGNEIDLLLWG